MNCKLARNMETDNESTLQEYQIQLEQVTIYLPLLAFFFFAIKFFKGDRLKKKVELALKSDSQNEELIKLKEDLLV